MQVVWVFWFSHHLKWRNSCQLLHNCNRRHFITSLGAVENYFLMFHRPNSLFFIKNVTHHYSWKPHLHFEGNRLAIHWGHLILAGAHVHSDLEMLRINPICIAQRSLRWDEAVNTERWQLLCVISFCRQEMNAIMFPVAEPTPLSRIIVNMCFMYHSSVGMPAV